MSDSSRFEGKRQVGFSWNEEFPWVDKKYRGLDLAAIYTAAHMPDLAERAVTCCTSMDWAECGEAHKLLSANFCKLRLCPLCTARKARKMGLQLSKVMNLVEMEHPGCRFLFLTLTIRNCEPAMLGETWDALVKGWHVFHRQSGILRSIKGWFRAGETTWNQDMSSAWYWTCHPHIHAILVVPSEYFGHEDLYLEQSELVQRWRKAMRLNYDPRVNIEATYAGKKTGQGKHSGSGTDRASKAATLEAAKYSTKDKEYINPKLTMNQKVEIVTTYTGALKGRRMTAFGGWMKDAARELQVEDEANMDLVHVDEDSLREDVVTALLQYHWSFGMGDYVLSGIGSPDGTQWERLEPIP